MPRRPNPKLRSVRTVYRTHCDAIHFRKLQLDEDATAAADLMVTKRSDGSNKVQSNTTTQ